MIAVKTTKTIIVCDYWLQNELGMLEFIHALVETLDKYFENVCELDIMFNLEKAHFILGERQKTSCPSRAELHGLVHVSLTKSVAARPCLPLPSQPARADEMVMNGCIVETNKTNVLKPILLLEKVAGK